MLSGGMLAAVPTTSSPFARIRPSTEDEVGAVVADAHPVVNDRAHLAVEDLIRIRDLFFQRRRNRHQLER